MVNIFSRGCGHQYFFFGEMSVHVFCLSFNWIFVFRVLSRISSKCFGHYPCIGYDICEYLLPLCRLSYYSYVFIVLLLCGNFLFGPIPNSLFLLSFPFLRRQSRKMMACSMSRSYCLPSCRMCMVSGLTLRSRNCFVCVCMVYKSSLISFSFLFLFSFFLFFFNLFFVLFFFL